MDDTIEITFDDTVCTIVIRNICTESEKDRVSAIVAAYRGAVNEYTDYFCYFYDDDPYEPDSSIGTRNVVPEGRFKDLTVQDVYAVNGHYSLSLLLQTVLKMKSAPASQLWDLYTEAVQFAIPLIRRKEIELDDFIHAYKPFLKGKGPTPEGDVEDWLKVPGDQQAIAYNELIDNITKRMEKSLHSAGGK